MKPRLTKRTADLLIALAAYARAEADVISDGTDEQQQEACDVREACDWISRLARWYYENHPTSQGALTAPPKIP